MDNFADFQATLTAPAFSAIEVTPSDTTDLPEVTRAIYVGQSGDLRVRMQDGTTVTFTATQAGAIYPLRVAQVLATGTDASGIVALA